LRAAQIIATKMIIADETAAADLRRQFRAGKLFRQGFGYGDFGSIPIFWPYTSLGSTVSDMETFSLRQGNVTAKLSEVSYMPAEGFQENNTWHVAEESISAESDIKLTNGQATIQHGGMNFPVTVTLLESETLPGEEDEEPEKGESACTIEIGYAEGLPKLALALGLS
jgi:hypothetical protein